MGLPLRIPSYPRIIRDRYFIFHGTSEYKQSREWVRTSARQDPLGGSGIHTHGYGRTPHFRVFWFPPPSKLKRDGRKSSSRSPNPLPRRAGHSRKTLRIASSYLHAETEQRMAPGAYDLYFTGSRGNPRQCIILGDDVEPIFYRFETPEVFMTDKRTTIYRNQDEAVAAFSWTADSYLGMCSVKNRQPFPMTMLVLPGSSASARAFFLNGSKFEWRRTRDDQFSYDLYHTPQNGQNSRIALFRTVDQATPLGPAHGFLQYYFVQPALLLEALLALSVNRWLDVNAM